MRISTSSDMYRHLDFTAACAEVKKAGCEGVDVWSSPRMCEHVSPDSRAGEIRAVLTDHGLVPAALTAYHTISPEESLERFLWSIDFAAQIGAPRVVTNGIDWPGDLPSFLEKVRPAVQAAEARGVGIAFENHAGFETPSGRSFWAVTQADLLAIAGLVPSPAWGFTIAPPHLEIRGADVPEIIRKLGRRVFFFYAWDHIRGADDDGRHFIWPPPHPEHQFPGNGQLDFRSYLSALREISYEASGGWVNIRSYPGYCPRPWTTDQISAALTRSIEYIKKSNQG